MEEDELGQRKDEIIMLKLFISKAVELDEKELAVLSVLNGLHCS
jgi:hypothetical protein